jgi:FkbM family methyltransferase
VDPTLLRLVSEFVRPGDSVWDVGANMGLFSFAAAVAAGPSGHVLAVEPDTDLAGLLRRSAAVADADSADADSADADSAGGVKHARVEVLPAAVAEELSVARFNIACRNRATSHLAGFGTPMAGGVRSTQLVPTVTLDWLATRFPVPDVLKIDVEGAELAVLNGGGQVLAQAPTVICEVAAENANAVFDILTSHGYPVYDGDQHREDRVRATAAPFNTLAVGNRARLKA